MYGATIVTAQVPGEVRDELVRRAHAADRSLSAEIRRALDAYVRGEPVPPRETSAAPGSETGAA